MGRPRKRRLVEEAPAPVEASSAVASGGQLGSNHDLPAVTFGDASLSFLDELPTSNFDFMDLLPYDYQDDAQFDPQILALKDGATDEAFPLSLNGVDLLSTINFDEDPNSSAASMSKDITDSLQRYWESQNLAAVEPPESLSTSSSESPSLSSADPAVVPTPKAVPSVPCGCLSSLYLALDSLSRLPPDVMGAVRTVRQATMVAHDVIQCPVCFDPSVEDPNEPIPIQSFQSFMCLATLIPSACNSYAAILEMVDEETAAAKRDGRAIWFSFKDIGGAWALVGPDGIDNDCSHLDAINRRNIEPDIWRTTMRAILRIDAYGFGEPPDDAPSATTRLRSCGLRSVVKQLEARNARRHDRMDSLLAAGKAPVRPKYLLQQPCKSIPPEQRNCVHILEAARIALDNLVIA